MLALNDGRAPIVQAANEAAERWDVFAGDLLADARAKLVDLQVRPADREADRAALEALAAWADRYTPVVAPFGAAEGEDGLFLDVTGATHLFGGEKALLVDLANRLTGFGLPHRLALAGSAGAAFALSRHDGRRIVRAAIGEDEAALRDLAVAALRLEPRTVTGLKRLGFSRIGDLTETPRAPLTARFGPEVLRRLDQALGRAPEILRPPAAIVLHQAARPLFEPIATHDAVVEVARQLMEDLAPALAREGLGARTMLLRLYRVDGAVAEIALGLAAPSRDPVHLARLVRLELERRGSALDAGFGFEALRLLVTETEPIEARQPALAFSQEAFDAQERLTVLIDLIRHRLGTQSLRRLVPRESHVPERAVAGEAVESTPNGSWPAPEPDAPARPIVLLDPAEPVEMIAPEGEPERFRWRGRVHRVASSEGPERIASEWWRHHGEIPSRDYFLVEDEKGRRLWLFREGAFPHEAASGGWFVHGLFA